MTVEFISKRQLTLEDISSLSDEIADIMCLDEEYQDNEYFQEQDFIIGILRHNDIEYSIIHGYPGDNATGIVFSGDTIIAHIGEGCDGDECDHFASWYASLNNEDLCI